jgi:hypothetical protein
MEASNVQAQGRSSLPGGRETKEKEMIGKIPSRVVKLTMAAFALVAVFAASSAAAAPEVIYNDLPTPIPGNVVSLGFEATQTSSFGGQVEFGAAARNNPTISVIMSSWACQSGTWSEKNCETTPGAKFEWPITFSVNAVGPGNSVGALLGSGSKVFKIAYRPSYSPKCFSTSVGTWYHKGECSNGKAVKLSLPLRIANLPSKAIVTISYNTSDYGKTPQRPQPCNSEPQGCPYDSLNVGVQDGFANPAGTSPTVGAFPAPDIAYVDGAPEEEWTGFQPLFEVKAH